MPRLPPRRHLMQQTFRLQQRAVSRRSNQAARRHGHGKDGAVAPPCRQWLPQRTNARTSRLWPLRAPRRRLSPSEDAEDLLFFGGGVTMDAAAGGAHADWDPTRRRASPMPPSSACPCAWATLCPAGHEGERGRLPSLAMKDGRVYSFGFGDGGRWGMATRCVHRDAPGGWAQGSGRLDIAAGGFHSLVLAQRPHGVGLSACSGRRAARNLCLGLWLWQVQRSGPWRPQRQLAPADWTRVFGRVRSTPRPGADEV